MFPIIVLRTGVLFGFIMMVDQLVSTRRPSTTVDNGLLTQGLCRDFWGLLKDFAGLRRTSHSRTRPGLLRTSWDFSRTSLDFCRTSAGLLTQGLHRDFWGRRGMSPLAQRYLQMAQHPLAHFCFFLCCQNWRRHCIACIVCKILSGMNFTYITSCCWGFH